jgi:DME family drug/metabolite transporter
MPDIPVHVVGVALSLGAATFASLQVVLVRIGSEHGGIREAVLLSMAVNVLTFVPAAILLEYPSFGVTAASVVAFCAAGLTGTLLGRALYYGSIERIGAGRTEPIKASMPLFATIIAVAALGEQLTAIHGVGILLIVAGIAAITWETASSEGGDVGSVSPTALALPLLAATAFAMEPVLVRFGFAEGTPVTVGLVLKTCAAMLGFVGYLRWRGALPTRAIVAAEQTPWYLAGAICNTISVVCYYAALRISRVVVVAPITQTSPLIVAALAYLFLRHLERITLRLVLSSMLVVAGAILVSVFA